MFEIIVSICTILLTATIAVSRILDIRMKMLDFCILHRIHTDTNGKITQTIERKTTTGDKVSKHEQYEDMQKYLMDFDIPFASLFLGNHYNKVLKMCKKYKDEYFKENS